MTGESGPTSCCCGMAPSSSGRSSPPTTAGRWPAARRAWTWSCGGAEQRPTQNAGRYPIRRGRPSGRLRFRRMAFAYSESAQMVRGALGSVLRQRREAVHPTLTEGAAEAGLSPAHLSEGERGRKEGSTQRVLAVAHALRVRTPHLYAPPARL